MFKHLRMVSSAIAVLAMVGPCSIEEVMDPGLVIQGAVDSAAEDIESDEPTLGYRTREESPYYPGRRR